MTNEEIKLTVPEFITPNEEAGIAVSIPTIDLSGEEFTELRKNQNRSFLEGDITPYLPEGMEAPTTISASVGASDVPSIMGTCTYDQSTIADKFREKLGVKKREISPALQALFDAGHANEYYIAKEFCDRHYLTLLRPTGMLYLASEPGFYSNVDYYALDESTGEISIIEIKNPNGYDRKAEVRRRYSNNLAAEQMYVDQVLYQMYISGVTKGYVVYGWSESPRAQAERRIDEVYGFPVEYDQERVDLIVKSVRIFIDALIAVDEKELLQLPGSSPKDFTIVYGEGEGELVTDGADWQAACDRYATAQDEVEAAKGRMEEAEAELRRLLGDKRKALVHNDQMDVEISTKTRDTKTWDLEKLQQIAPDVYQENLSFSITDAKLKKLPNKEDVESCLTVEKKPVAGVKITVVKNK